jgi:hypothetical protein
MVSTQSRYERLAGLGLRAAKIAEWQAVSGLGCEVHL